ncbi:hypothetical protein LASA110932_08225 [Latilactobacillus sakei]
MSSTKQGLCTDLVGNKYYGLDPMEVNPWI